MRIKNKGAVMSSIAFLVLASLLSLAYLYSSSSISIRSLVTQNLIANKIYYNFHAILRGTIRIIEEELGGVTNPEIQLNISVDEQPDYSYVSVTEKIPQEMVSLQGFRDDLGKYEQFVETYMPESNVEIDTGISALGESMTLVIEPYDILYTHERFGQREFFVIPENTENSLGKVNGYDFTIKFLGAWRLTSPGAWGPFKSGDLRISVSATDEFGTYTYETTEYVSRTEASQLKIDASGPTGGYVRVRIGYAAPGAVTLEVHEAEITITTSLNLTDIPGRTEVDLPDGKINVVETLYNIEKNDTVRMT